MLSNVSEHQLLIQLLKNEKYNGVYILLKVTIYMYVYIHLHTHTKAATLAKIIALHDHLYNCCQLILCLQCFITGKHHRSFDVECSTLYICGNCFYSIGI